jgi:hypothetical protein
MKKIIAAVAATALMLSFGACSSNKNGNGTVDNDTGSDTHTSSNGTTAGTNGTTAGTTSHNTVTTPDINGTNHVTS